MSWIQEEAAVGVLMPDSPVQAPNAIKFALCIARAFPRHRFYVKPDIAPALGLFLKGDENLVPDVVIDLSYPPDRPEAQPAARTRITANPEATGFNILIRPKHKEWPGFLQGLIRVLGVEEMDFEPELQHGLQKARLHMQRSGYYQGRLRVFMDKPRQDIQEGFRKILGTEVMFFSPRELDVATGLMLLKLSDLYIGGNSVFTGFALSFGNRCALTERIDPVPFGERVIKMVNPKQTLKRFGFLD